MVGVVGIVVGVVVVVVGVVEVVVGVVVVDAVVGGENKRAAQTSHYTDIRHTYINRVTTNCQSTKRCPACDEFNQKFNMTNLNIFVIIENNKYHNTIL